MIAKISLALNIILLLAVAYLFSLVLKSGIEDMSDAQPAEVKSEIADTGYPSIAFVDNDSLSLNYQFRIDKSKILEKAAADVQALENQLANAQNQYYDIMNKSQTGGFANDAEIASAEKKLMRLQDDVPYIQSQMEKKLQKLSKLEMEINDSLYARLYRYIDTYTADKPIDVIMLYTKGMTGLYNNHSLDVTTEIVNGLNQAYAQEKGAEGE